MLDREDTICAIASPAGPALRGVVRISGPGTAGILARILVTAEDAELPARGRVENRRFPGPPRRIAGRIATETPLGTVDAHALVWPNQRSYTGQPSAELHLFGSGPLLQAVLDLLMRNGARLAAPGEFTLRSFLAGRLDLVQAEAVLGVIDADTRSGLGVALDQLTGGVSAPLQQLREEMLALLADVEAGLDFVDENIQFIDDAELAARLSTLSRTIQASADQMASRGRAGDSPVVALCGLPNAGKSRLMNALTGMESSIVSDRVGTTRDPVEVRLQFGERSLRVVDTAGVEEMRVHESSSLDVSDQAQRLGRSIADAADLRLWCQDSAGVDFAGRAMHRDEIKVATKVDQIDFATRRRLEEDGWILTSAVTGFGLQSLAEAILRRTASADERSTVEITAARCRETLAEAASGLAAASEIAQIGSSHELIAAELRMALDAVGRVTGAVYTDDILDSIFSRFCIGK